MLNTATGHILSQSLRSASLRRAGLTPLTVLSRDEMHDSTRYRNRSLVPLH